MSAQINLYHPRFLKQRDLLTLSNVALAAGGLYAVLAAVGGWAWLDAAGHREAGAATEVQLKAARQQVDAATKAAAARKPSPQLIAEVEGAESLLRRRGEIARLLEGGVVGSTGGFSEYMRGLARQAPQGLWLTGFTIDSGGSGIEIRGSTLNPDALPDYIRRLGSERAFQGRNFAALTMSRAESPAAVRPGAQGAAVAPAPTSARQPIDFVLMPKLVDAKGVQR